MISFRISKLSFWPSEPSTERYFTWQSNLDFFFILKSNFFTFFLIQPQPNSWLSWSNSHIFYVKTQKFWQIWMKIISIGQSMKLLRNCSETFQKLLWNCSETAPKLIWNFSKLLLNCSETAPKLLWNCSEFALKLLWICSETALKLLWIMADGDILGIEVVSLMVCSSQRQ